MIATVFRLLSFERVLILSTASLPRYRGRCWAAIRLSHRPELSGRVVRGGSMDWTVEDDMFDGLFCATLTGRRGGNTSVALAWLLQCAGNSTYRLGCGNIGMVVGV